MVSSLPPMTSGKASREIRRQKVTERRLRVARAEATRLVVRIGGVLLVVVAAVLAGVYFVWLR